ncbi:conserved Plasmodium protein, unknown function [Plasmodium relictum]|uniref:Uncharacterized protein n=1 Tax=Plasmodium relictum TaxID=85471 RepID=A0A1J1HB80_PLARL|nr:conserved Plasmodium protein, unknown function [Plasmodium relictum]CRH02551.1 conserved Plasmodium protein, unknown function [Plasmodium relictum]
MLLKNISLIKCLQCVQLNIVVLFSNKKNTFSILRSYSSFDKIYEKEKENSYASFFYDNTEKQNNEIFSDLKNSKCGKSIDNIKNKIKIETDSKYTYTHIDTAKVNPFNIFSNKIYEQEDFDIIKDENEQVKSENYQGKDEEIKEDGDMEEEYEEMKEEDENMEKEYEEIEDDIDTLLFTNSLNSSFIGELWHSSANSLYRSKENMNNLNLKKKIINNKRDLHICNDEEYSKNFNDETIKNTLDQINYKKEKYLIKDTKYEINNEIKNKIENTGKNEFNLKRESNSKRSGMEVHPFINEIYEEEKNELEKMKEFFEKNEEKFMKFRNSILCKLKISEELAKKYKHSSKEVSILKKEKNKEEYYKNLIDSLNCTSNQQEYSEKKKKKNVNYDNIETIKILDIDSLPCNVLNHLFAYKIVKNCSAELCLKIISRIGMYRDKYSQVSYENMINYLGQIINNDKNAEIIALFSRCYETVSIPFLVNYVRKYGSFSRSFIVNMYDKYFKKRLFDFVRYENNLGIRKIPNILTHPYHLSSYIKLLGECSAKKDMYIQLKIRGFIPSSSNYYDEKNIQEMDYFMNQEKGKTKKINMDVNKKKSNKYIERPKMYDVILSAEHSGLPIEHFIEKSEKEREILGNFNNLIENVIGSDKDNSINNQVLSASEHLEERENIEERKIKDKLKIEDKGEYEMEYKENTISKYKIKNQKNTEEETCISNDEIKNNSIANEYNAIKSTHSINNNEKEEEESNKNTDFILDEDCDIYLYKGFNKLNKSSFKLQTTLVKSEYDKNKNDLVPYSNNSEHFEEIEKNDESLWELPWKTKKKNSFFFKGRFFKILPNEGWSEIKDISKKYIRPKRKRTKHFIRRKRILQKKIKINLFKKKILENYNKNK